MKTIGVIGAGTMGIGVAISLLQKKISVRLIDIDKDQIGRAKTEIENKIAIYSMLRGIDIDEEATKNNILYSTDIQTLKYADIIIENISENIEEKNKLYHSLESICKKDCIFMINTSCIPIKDIAQDLSIKTHMLGVHFMNPVPLIDAVEVIQAESTSEGVLSEALLFLKGLGKDMKNVDYHLSFNEKDEPQLCIVVNEQIDGEAESYRPEWYFSTAQLNTVAFSSFFGRALSTKSLAFRTIFVDDPISHFDDMNMLGFSDMIRSIIESMDCQIIMSTHDRKIYNILRRKLDDQYYSSCFINLMKNE